MGFVLYVFMLVHNEYNWVPNGEFENALLCQMAGNEMYRKESDDFIVKMGWDDTNTHPYYEMFSYMINLFEQNK